MPKTRGKYYKLQVSIEEWRGNTCVRSMPGAYCCIQTYNTEAAAMRAHDDACKLMFHDTRDWRDYAR